MSIRSILLVVALLPTKIWAATATLDLPYGSYDLLQNPVNGDVNIVLRGNISDSTDTVFSCSVDTGADQITLRARTAALNLDQRLAIVLTAIATKSSLQVVLRDDAAAVPDGSPFCAVVNLVLIPRAE